MAKFLDQLVYTRTGKKVGGRPVYRLVFDFRFDYGSGNQEHVITVPAGFETDLTSVPRLLWTLLPPWVAEEAAVVHDAAYRSGEFDRRVADAIFAQALKVSGVGFTTRMAMWLSVRLFGKPSYRRLDATAKL